MTDKTAPVPGPVTPHFVPQAVCGRESDALTVWIRSATLALGMACCAFEAQAQQNQADDARWFATGDALEACIVAEEKSYATGHECIGRFARKCLEIAQREPLVRAEKCYEPEVAAWARLVNRYFDVRPRDARGERIAEVQRVWRTYRDLKCRYVDFHHSGGDLGRWQSQICLMEENGRRAIELRSFRAKG